MVDEGRRGKMKSIKGEAVTVFSNVTPKKNDKQKKIAPRCWF